MSRNLTRRSFLSRFAAGSALLAGGLFEKAWAQKGASSAPATRPDILFIAIEDVSPMRFGCWGNTVCKTPNIDRLASEGLRFDQAHCMAAPCNPSRTALLLGLRPETTGVYGNGTDWRKKVSPETLTMPEHFVQHGYETMRLGKISHGSFERPQSWSVKLAQIDLLEEEDEEDAAGGDSKRRKNKPATAASSAPSGGKLKLKNVSEGRPHPGVPFQYGPSGLEDEQEPDGITATRAIEILDRKFDKPILLALGFHRPHLPFTCPQKYFDMYKPEDMEIPGPVTTDSDGYMNYGTPDHRNFTEQTWREAIAAHYAALTFADAQIGRVLDHVRKTGRDKNMIVVFWSDHGFILGEHGAWRKGPLYNEVTRVALIAKAPGVTQAGSVCKRPVESIDLFPTLFELAGIPQMPGLEAISMKSLLENPNREWKKGAITVRSANDRSIATEKWRYTQLKGGEREELFDEVHDPRELNNLATDERHAQVKTELKALLEGGWKACLPEEFA